MPFSLLPERLRTCHQALGRGVIASLIACASLHLSAAETLPMPRPFILDMVHHNPGEPVTQTPYEDPAVIRKIGFNGKVFFLFDSPTLAVNWDSVDPTIFPAGSPDRAWVDAKAARIDAQQAACVAAGIRILAMTDLILLPKKLVETQGIDKTFGDINQPTTERYLRLLLDQTFTRFPRLDGLVVRIGETYLHDAPYHQGSIHERSDAKRTIIPLVRILREELCVKRGKQLIFRTWRSFDEDAATYQAVSDATEPHPLLVFGVKHCEGDFHRGNPFSKIIGTGRHPQVIEVQCAREYEGKGAYPDYIAHGVIDGFEEHRTPAGTTPTIGAFARTNPLYAGIWTWSRGGGWGGPYITNELWCDLNVWIMATWAADPKQDEAALFQRFATERLALTPEDAGRLRQIALRSADATLRGRVGSQVSISPWWSRDDGMCAPKLPKDPVALRTLLADVDAAAAIWGELATIARAVTSGSPATRDYLVVSTDYGRHLYRIHQAFFHLCALRGADGKGTAADRPEIDRWLAAYDAAWADFRALPATSQQCATLYREEKTQHQKSPGIDEVAKMLRR